MRTMISLILAFALTGCASAPPSTDPAPAGGATPTPGSGVSRIDSPWPVKTRLHIDLWLHGFAMLQADTTKVPYFRPGYVSSQRAAKSAANVSTLLDANRADLAARFTINRDLPQAQFLALYFENWDQLVQGISLFLSAEGDPRRGSNAVDQQVIYTFSRIFPTAADREWLRRFGQSLQDEHNRWYRTWWTQEQRNRAAVIEAVDSLWNRIYRPKVQGYLNNTQQSSGDLFLSLPLDGEGRAVSGVKGRGIIAVGFPERQADAIEAVYVFAHEAAAAVSAQAINDNTSPAEKREPSYEAMQGAGLVRGGQMLLAKVAPDLVPGYARYYLRVSRTASSADPVAALAREFPLPEPIRAAMERQINIVLGGI